MHGVTMKFVPFVTINCRTTRV